MTPSMLVGNNIGEILLGARGVDMVTVQQLLRYSSFTVTMRYTHTNLDAKRNATQKLEGFSENLVTVHQNAAIANQKCHQTTH